MIKSESILYGVIGLLTGAIIAGFGAAYAVNNNYTGMMNMMGMHTNNTRHGMMDDMTSTLEGKTGDDFDKVFINEMIAHHQGAIDMANLAKQNAKHEEIKSLANDIITAQAKEINKMKDWQTQWGYSTSSSDKTYDTDDMMSR